MLVMSGKLKKLIVSADSELAPIRKQAQKEGMRPLRISGLQKVANGATTLDEVFRVAPPYSDE